jgi:hypothetical protein
MTTQNYRVLEASAEPLDQSWYVGRDIGKVGYFVPVRVFDTDGLFTPDVVQSEPWAERRVVAPSLLAQALNRRPVALELLDDWTPAAARSPALWQSAYEIVDGSTSSPDDLLRARIRRPSPGEVLRRYEVSWSKFPRLFYMQTLYGESVSAAMFKRLRYIRERVADLTYASPFVDSQVLDSRVVDSPSVIGDDMPGAGATLDDGALEVLGCLAAPADLAPGDRLRVECAFRVHRSLSGHPWFFWHFERQDGQGRFLGDHPPLGGLLPVSDWTEQEVVRDIAAIPVPPNQPEGSYRLFFGMFDGTVRLRARPIQLTDGNDRVKGPAISVRSRRP